MRDGGRRLGHPLGDAVPGRERAAGEGWDLGGGWGSSLAWLDLVVGFGSGTLLGDTVAGQGGGGGRGGGVLSATLGVAGAHRWGRAPSALRTLGTLLLRTTTARCALHAA